MYVKGVLCLRISAKGRYALASTISLAELYKSGEFISLITLSEKLGISKIYLEQVFSLLKHGDIVNSVKGSKGGYQLSRMPKEITVMDVLITTELSLFEPTSETVNEKAPEIDDTIREDVFDVLDNVVKATLREITLADLLERVQKRKGIEGLMYYI